MKIILCTIVSFLLVSCGEKQKSNNTDFRLSDVENDMAFDVLVNDVGARDTSDGESCSSLSEVDCKTDSRCISIFAAPYNYADQCVEPEIFAFCATHPIVCNNGVQEILYDSSTNNCWFQNASCVPGEWISSDSPNFPQDCLAARQASECT